MGSELLRGLGQLYVPCRKYSWSCRSCRRCCRHGRNLYRCYGEACAVHVEPRAEERLRHLSRDLGIPADLEAAAQVAANGLITSIDVGTVNGQRFVNNASIGLYPVMVRQREALREARGWPKWFASIPASWSALSRLPHHRLRIDMGESKRPLVTPLLFVGNNMYSMELNAVGTRASLQDGQLSVFAVAHKSRLGLIWFALRGLVGQANKDEDFIALGECKELTVWSRGKSIELALDGEILRLATPLHFEIEAGALKILVPRPEAITSEHFEK